MATIRETLEVVDQATAPLARIAAGVGGVIIAFEAARRAIASMTQGFADAVNDLGDFATRVGSTTEVVAGLKLAIEGAGGSIEQMEAPLRSAQGRLLAASRGSKEAAAGFRALGVDIFDAGGDLRVLDDVLMDTTRALAAIDDPAKRSQLAMGALGESAGVLMQALGGEELEQFIDRARIFGVDVGPQAAGAASEWQRNVADLSMVWDGFVVSMGEGITGRLNPLIRDFTTGLVGAAAFLGAGFSAAREELALLVEEVRAGGGLLRSAGEMLGVTSVGPRGGIDEGGLAGALTGLTGGDAPEGFADRMRRVIEAATEAMDGVAGEWLATRPGGARGVLLTGGDDAPTEEIVASVIESMDAANQAVESGLERNRALWAAHTDAVNALQRTQADEAARVQAQIRSTALSAGSDILGAARSMAGETLGIAQALGVAQVTISTIAAVMQAMAQLGPVAGPIASAGIIAGGLASAAQIMSTGMGDTPGGGSIGSSMTAMPADAIFAPGGEGPSSMGGGAAPSGGGEVRVRTYRGYAMIRDIEDETRRIGRPLHFLEA